MSLYNGIVTFDWKKLENQPLYVKSSRKENEKQGYRIELAVDRSTNDNELRGELFYVYGKGIEDIPTDVDVSIVIDKEKSMFMRDTYGFNPYVVVESVTQKLDKTL